MLYLSNSASNFCRLVSASFFGVSQNNYFDFASVTSGTLAFVTGSGNATTSESLGLDILLHENSNVSSAATNQTVLYATDQGVWNDGESYRVATSSGLFDMSWTPAGNDSCVYCMCAYKTAESVDTGSSNDAQSFFFQFT